MLLRATLLIFLCALPGGAHAQPLVGEPISPLPPNTAGDEARIALGRTLFYEKRLSHDNRQNCVSCHDLGRGGADGRGHSNGFSGRRLPVNTPSIYNTAFNFRQTWLGKAATIEVEISNVFTNPKVFATSWGEVLGKLGADATLAAGFRQAYGAPPDQANVTDALASFLRTLATPSRMDRYLRGDPNAISQEEKLGYAKFKSYGCIACHQGVNVGGNMYQKIGVMQEVPGLGKGDADLGRFLITGRASDKHVFRVPSLRNVALTAPYLHNGSIETLDGVVAAMFKYQLGRSSSAQDRALIVKFLHTLNGEVLPPPGATPP